MKIKKVFVLFVMIAVSLSVTQVTYAQNMPNEDDMGYLEYHYQVNFDDLDVFVINGTTLDVSLSDGVDPNPNTKIANDVDALMAALSESSETEEEIIDTLKDNQQLAAISFTEAPLLLVDDHYERVMAAAASTYEASSPNGKGKFTMYTTVSRSYSSNSNGKYNYTTKTLGSWSQNSASGGSDYPDSGDDFILQSTPNTWTRKSDYMTARYDSSPFDGTENDEFWSAEGGQYYLQYGIQDDPYEFAQARQNKSFALTCDSEGGTTTSARMINSYYIHTWEENTIDSVSITADTSKQVALQVNLSKKEKYWPSYNYVTFNF